MQTDNQKLIKSTTNISKQELDMLREKFLSEYVRKKGWNKSNLSPEQMLEIIEQKGYKSPCLIFS